MNGDLEKRFLSGVRAEAHGANRRLVGYAARYGAVADIGPFRERIAKGAFARSLEDNRDILALLDHNPTHILGRTRSKTLRLRDEDDGLVFDVAVPDTNAGRDALALAERNDLGGASIGFIVEEEDRDGDTRVIERAQLLEISIVSAWPAYAETTVEARRGVDVLPRLGKPRLDTLRRYLETV